MEYLTFIGETVSEWHDREWLVNAQKETIDKFYEMRTRFFEREQILKEELEAALKQIVELSRELK